MARGVEAKRKGSEEGAAAREERERAFGEPKGQGLSPPPPSPAWSRWEDVVWNGRDLHDVGMSLKAKFLDSPGCLGLFSSSQLRAAAPLASGGVAVDPLLRLLLPLPVPGNSPEEDDWARRRHGALPSAKADIPDDVLRGAAGAASWLWVVVVSLNWMHAGRGQTALAAVSHHGPASPSQASALEALQDDVLYFLKINGGVVRGLDWAKHLVTRRVSYQMEEMGAAQPLSWARMAPGLPSGTSCGRVPAVEIAEPGMRELLEDPSLTMLPASLWPAKGLVGRCHHVITDKDKIADGLLGVGRCVSLPLEEVACCRSGPLLNGWFGVGKGKYLPGGDGDPDAEILRFIMNFVPLNALSKPIIGDVEQLPYMGQWSNLQLEMWEHFVWSSEDIACMFYVISIPSCWLPFMALT